MSGTVAHLARIPFRAMCGADEPGQRTIDYTSLPSQAAWSVCSKCVQVSLATQREESDEVCIAWVKRCRAAEKAIAKARKLMRRMPPAIRPDAAYRALDWRNR